MTEIVSNSVLPAKRELINIETSDGQSLVGEIASPLDQKAIATIINLTLVFIFLLMGELACKESHFLLLKERNQ